ADGLDAVAREGLSEHRTNSPQATHGERPQEGLGLPWLHHQQAVGLTLSAGDLRHQLVGAETDAHHQIRFLTDSSFERGPELPWGTEQAEGAANVQESLVEGEGLHLGGELLEDFAHLARHAAVLLHVTAHEDPVRAQLSRAKSWHRRAHSEAP